MSALVKAGYKQTGVGVIPVEWAVSTITESAEMTTVGFVGSMSHLFTQSGVPVLRGQDVKPNLLDATDTKFISNATHQLWSKSALKGGDVVIVRVGASAGTSCVIPDNLGEANAASIVVIRPARKRLDANFLSEIINSDFGKRQVESLLVGGAQPVINTATVAAFEFPLPPVTEQRAIAAALSDIDALISGLDQLIAKKRDIKQAAVQQLLTGQQRLPGFSGEWEVKTFEEIFEFLSTATNARSDLTESGDTYYLHYGDIHTRFHGHLNFGSDQPPKIERAMCNNAAFIRNGDWVMADASEDFAGVGKTIEVSGLPDDVRMVAGLHTFLLREKTPTFATGFKGHLGSLESLHQQYLRVATGMKVYGVSKAALKNLVLPVPKLEEQTAIAAVLSDMDGELSTLKARCDKARQIKLGMMQELLTGRIRLN